LKNISRNYLNWLYFVLNYLPVYVLTTIWNCPTVKSEVSEQESTVSTIGAGGKFEINNQLVNNDNLLDVINWTIDRLPNNRIIIFLITLILTRAFVNFAGCFYYYLPALQRHYSQLLSLLPIFFKE
jgi:hypothetical protein